MTILEKVQSLLEAAFPPPDKITLEDDDGIIGAVASERFVGMETLDRIKLIWKTLRRGLTPEQLRRVVIIVAVTPLEEIAHTS